MFEKNKYKTELIIPLFDGRERIYNTLWATTSEQKVITVEALRVTTSQATTHLVCYAAVFRVVTQRSSPLVGRSVAWQH